MFNKGLEWNQAQLRIAKLLQEKKTFNEIISILGCKYLAVWKINKAIENGDLPPSLDEA